MKKILIAGACALAAAALCGCQALQGAVGFNNALVPQLKPMQVGIQPGMKCSDLAAKVAAAGPLDIGQMVALYTACETMQDDQKLLVDPQGARKALDAAIVKPLPVPASAAPQ